MKVYKHTATRTNDPIAAHEPVIRVYGNTCEGSKRKSQSLPSLSPTSGKRIPATLTCPELMPGLASANTESRPKFKK